MAVGTKVLKKSLLGKLSAKFPVHERLAKSKAVESAVLERSKAICQPNFLSIETTDLHNMFNLLDAEYFGGLIRKVADNLGRPISFRLSKRMTNSGGITSTNYPIDNTQPIEYEIAIASTLLFQSFQDQKPILVTGILCTNRLQALQRIIEHELIHLIEMLLWDDSSCSAPRFQLIAATIFGHKKSSHQLITPTDVAKSKFDISAGDWVQFSIKGQLLSGYVNRITKRATVLVPANKGIRYTDGKLYQKYYVPVHKLRRTSA